MEDKIKIYSAAALFNGREAFFNSCLVEGLESIGYNVNSPQRDGFEFGNLIKTLSGKVEIGRESLIAKNIIYFLDMGIFIPNSDVVLANFDEPLDEGVVVESSYAKLMGKFVVGLRTDVRSPYGSPDEVFGGVHSFPACQSDKFISHYMSSRTTTEGGEQMKSLVDKIDCTISNANVVSGGFVPKYVTSNPNFDFVLKGAYLLFEGVKDIHSKDGLNKIVSRYIDNEKVLSQVLPDTV